MRISDWSSDVCSSDLYHEQKAFQREECFPAHDLSGDQVAVIGDAITGKFFGQGGSYFHRIGIGQPLSSQKSSQKNTGDKEQVPDLLFPIVFEERNTSGYARCTDRSEARREGKERFRTCK